MDYLTSQIKLHEDIIQVHTTQLKYLQDLQKQKELNIDSINTLEDIPETKVLEDEDMLLHDQDIIWERIRNAHPELYGNKSDYCNQTHTETGSKEKIVKENNLNEEPHVIKPDMQIHPVEEDKITNPGYKVNPIINRLSKFTTKKQNQILKNIFLTAKSNMEKLAELDPNIANGIDEKIHIEANRLLEAYLDE